VTRPFVLAGAAPLAAVCLLIFLYEPAEALAATVLGIRLGVAYFAWGAAAARLLADGGERRQRGLEAALLAGLALLVRGPVSFRPGFEWPFLLAAGAAGMALVRHSRSREACRRWVSKWREQPLSWTIAVIVLLSLPGLVLPVVRLWNISGLYDSHQYDRDAHAIATGTIPQGNSFVMPLYQYGMAFFYFFFGHFFAVQQIVNVLMAAATIVFVALAAWNLFRRQEAVAIAALVVGMLREFQVFLTVTQIEAWYVPAIALTLWTVSWYFRSPSAAHAAALGISVGIAFNLRSQGLFYFGLLCLLPWFVRHLPRMTRARHTLIVAGIVSLSLLPWSLRNYFVEGRFTPASDQAAVALLFNHPDVGFYGLRYDLAPWWTIYAQYEKRFPDKAERFRYMRREFIRNVIADPARQGRAFFWRSLSFYGLLPPGIRHPDGPRPTDWSVHWRPYVLGRFTSIFLIAASLLGLLWRPGRVSAFLLLCVLANLGIMLIASQNEVRISYPILPMHLLMALCVAFVPVVAGAEAPPVLGFSTEGGVRRHFRSGALGLLLFLVVAYAALGRRYQHAPLRESAVVVEPSLTIDRSVRSLRRIISKEEVARVGERVRTRVIVTNYLLPPKNDNDRPEVPWWAAISRRESYYHAHFLEGGTIAVTYFGAMTSEPLREGDAVEIEGVLLEVHAPGTALRYYTDWWLRAEKVVRLHDEVEAP
jgi:4-amino-4-deoxy-L-arabinose transferase-like glycosyltransferase